MITTSNAVMLFILLTQRIIRHTRRWLGVATLLGLSACSTLQLAYNSSDEFVYWWLNGYVDLQDTQKPLVRNALQDLQQWHRQDQLPQYATMLQRLQTMAPQPVTATQVCAVTHDMQSSFITLLRHVEPAATQLAMSLKPEQLQRLRQRYDSTNQDWRDEWLTPSAEDRLKHRYKLSLNRLEDFYGKLDAPQRELIQQWLAQSKFDPEQSYAERDRRQADSLQTLQRMASSKDAAQNQSLLRGWLDRSFTSPNERTRAYVQTLWQDNCEGFAKLHNSTTPAQRERLVRTLKNYEADVRALMARKP
jgi:hypothetical protein